jgi:hypothetical protein
MRAAGGVSGGREVLMSKDKMKGYVGAFCAGGILGVAGQAIAMLYMRIGLPFPIQSMILTLGVLGALCSFLGVFQKIAPIGGMGVDMTMFGLAGGISMLIIHGRENKMKAPVHFGMDAPIKIFGVGTAIALVLAAVMFFTGNGGAA